MKSWSSFIASNSVSTIKICRKKNSAGSFGFSKNQRKWERLSARGKNGNKKPLLHGCVSFHVAAVYAVGYSVEISERQAGIYELNAVTNDKYLSVFFLISSSLTP